MKKNQINDNKKKNEEYEIKISRKARIFIDGKKYKVNSKIIKNGINLSPTEVQNILDKYVIIKDEASERLENLISEKLVDPMVINAINNSRIPKDSKKDIIINYLYDVFSLNNTKRGKVEYNLEDLSKTSLFKKITGNEMDFVEKHKFEKIARKHERYGLATVKGDYISTRKAKLLSFITRRSITTEPKINDIYKAAKNFNDLIDLGQTSGTNNRSYLEQLQINKGFTDGQIKELKDLSRKYTQERDER